MRVIGFLQVAVVSGIGLAAAVSAQQLTMTVDAGKTGAPISKFIYGQFTENANNNFYRGGLWAEMLEDRKFYYPITATQPVAPAPGRGGRGAPRRVWTAVGGESAVTMDEKNAYSGKQSAAISVDGTSRRGVRQSGLAIKKGQRYTGRVVLSSDPGVEVQVSLISGPNPSDRQNVRITGIGPTYRKFPLAFTGAIDSADASIEITGTGKGAFRIGAVSLMPADNVKGWRADSIQALKEIGPTMIRYGGNFLSDYDWRVGVGDIDQRPSRFDYAWNQMDPNDVGTDEILALNALLGSEPYMDVNSGFGDAFSAAQWVEYCNGATTTPMGKLRAANGRPAPYNVKWWNIGNEMYGPWQMGHMAIKQYAIKHNLFAEAMRRVDPTIKIVAVGADPAEMSTTGAGRSYGTPVVEFGTPTDWNFVMLSNSLGNFDSLSEHLYPKNGQAFDPGKQDFVPVEESAVDNARRLPNRVKTTVEAWQEYQKLFPKLDMKKIPIALDEWLAGYRGGAARSPMFGALTSAEALHEIFRNSEWFVMSAYTHLTGLVNGRNNETVILPVGRMFEIYRRHFGTIPVEVEGNSPQHEVKGTVNVDKPRVSSGSATYPLDVAAAFTADRKTLTVAIVNPSDSDQQIEAIFKGVSLQPSGKLLRIAAPESAAGIGAVVNIAETALTETPAKMTIPKQTINLYELPVR